MDTKIFILSLPKMLNNDSMDINFYFDGQWGISIRSIRYFNKYK